MRKGEGMAVRGPWDVGRGTWDVRRGVWDGQFQVRAEVGRVEVDGCLVARGTWLVVYRRRSPLVVSARGVLLVAGCGSFAGWVFAVWLFAVSGSSVVVGRSWAGACGRCGRQVARDPRVVARSWGWPGGG